MLFDLEEYSTHFVDVGGVGNPWDIPRNRFKDSRDIPRILILF